MEPGILLIAALWWPFPCFLRIVLGVKLSSVDSKQISASYGVHSFCSKVLSPLNKDDLLQSCILALKVLKSKSASHLAEEVTFTILNEMACFAATKTAIHSSFFIWCRIKQVLTDIQVKIHDSI